MTPQNVESCLKEVRKHFQPQLIQVSNFVRQSNVVSWQGYVGGIANSLSYARNYENFLNSRQYSFLLVNDALVQYYYRFDEAGLRSARLALYPKPIDVFETTKDFNEYFENTGNDLLAEIYLGLSEWMVTGVRVVNTSHLRLDYDRDVVTHAKGHIQFGGCNDIRIPSSAILNPLVFFCWLVPMLCAGELLKEFDHVFGRQRFRAVWNYWKARNFVTQVQGEFPYLASQQSRKRRLLR